MKFYKLRKIVIFFILTFFLNYIANQIFSLSGWIAIILALAASFIIVSFIPKGEDDEDEYNEQGEGGEIQAGISRGSEVASGAFGILVLLFFLAIPVAIIALVWLPMVGPVLSLSGVDVMKETYDAKRLQTEAVCSGDCQIGSTGIDLWYKGSFYIKNSENIAISRIVITTEYLYDGAMVQTYIGPYEFLMTVGSDVYSGSIALGEDISDVPGNSGNLLPQVKKNKDGIPEAVPILIKTNKMDIYPVVWIYGINKPMMKMLWEPWMAFFGNNILVGSYGKDVPVEGKVTIASLGGQLRIKKVEIYKKII